LGKAACGVATPAFEDDLPPIFSFGPRLPATNLGAVGDAVAQSFHPGEGCLFDDGFGKIRYR